LPFCSFTGRVEALEATVNSLEEQLEEQSSDADDAIAQWQESYSALEAHNSELESQSIERVKEIESTIKNLEGQLEEQSNDFDNAILQWEESYAALEDLNSKLEKQLETITKNDELAQGAKAHAEAATEPQEISEVENSKHVSQIKDLESKLVGTGEELLLQRQEYDAAVSSWELLRVELEAEVLLLEEDVESETAEKNRLLTKVAAFHAANKEEEVLLESTKADLKLQQTRVDDLENKLLELEDERSQEREEAMAAISQWESSCRQLEDRIAALEGDLARMTEQRENLGSFMEEPLSELVDQRTSDVEILSKKVAKAQLGDESANAAAPQGSVVTAMASLKSQLDEEKEAHTSTQSELLAIRRELEFFTAESEEIVDLWKGEYSLGSRLL
jgi:DNA repair exonuclease SbcCD ATPase subunit